MSDLGNKAVIAENICRYMARHQETRTDLSALLDVPYTTITNWTKGKTYPRIDKIERLAQHWGIRKSDLVERRSTTVVDGGVPYHVTGRIPILGYIPAGYPQFADNEILGYEPTDISDPESCFWLRVQGDSMINAGIKPNDLVLIRQQPCAKPGQIVACRVNGDEATLKRFNQQGDTILLMPENPAYKPYIIKASEFDSGYASIIGVAIEIKRKL